MAREKKNTRKQKAGGAGRTTQARATRTGAVPDKPDAAQGTKRPSNAEGAARTGRPKTRPAADVVTASGPTLDDIRRRAYEIYLRRGGTGGDPAADWLQAERELRDEIAQRGR